MLFGILMKGLNNIYFKEWVGFTFEFIPQFLFMCLTFGFMDALIIIKWNENWTGDNSGSAPGIIN